ncbi:alpha/beta fold hydrolase [Lederbergia wuyishanensis]|uniref:alpha/beta fold hydrolase n=1 Tax=Lederbergia wuyishanensis TaxID=1347903 RepID=UPI001FD3ECAC|nr:alpha/beta hydrolase [Lederbergia wuyishanensis]MCJ8007325.1 alpha/beta hydrolase [Lederbergia wuyishanensis]
MENNKSIHKSNCAPIILVPGFWLGSWAWDEVTEALRSEGHNVTALTLPGLESADADRSNVKLSDHVDAICDAVRAAGEPVVLAVHSGAAVPGYEVSDRMPEQIAAMVYVDTFPLKGAINSNFDGIEMSLPPWEELDETDIRGMSDEHRNLLKERAIPEPGDPVRQAPELVNDNRLDVPSIVICTSHTSDEMKAFVKGGHEWFSGLAELRDVTYIDLPTHHWPMWSRPKELASVIGDVARHSSAD